MSAAYKETASERSSVSCRRTMVGVGMGALLALAALLEIAGGEALNTINASVVGKKASTPDQRTVVDGEPTELILIHALFRHGDRTPDREEMELYPEDPNIDNDFEPYGLKALTNGGKAREYKIGTFLRNYYSDYLNEIYRPEDIYVRTTDYDRTKMSALACLAGLYPPKGEQIWNNELMWQPIPYHTLSFEEDDLMYYYTCPRFNEARTELLESAEFRKKLEDYKDVFEEISRHVGMNLTTPEEVFYLDNLFQAEQNYDIPPPKWAVELMDKIKEITVLEYELEFATDELKKVAGGTLLKKMITDSYAKIKRTLDPPGRKLFLYSAHENNVAAILACSGVFKAHQPPYGATFILELRQKLLSKTYGFRILYLRDVDKPPEVLTIPGCETFCPFEKFVQLTSNTITSTLKKDCASKRVVSTS